MRLEVSIFAVGVLILLAMTDSGMQAPHVDAMPASPPLPVEAALPVTAAPVAPAALQAVCLSEANLVERVQQYEFYGARADAAGQSLRQRLLVSTDHQGRQNRFTGQTDWHIEWRACFLPSSEGCRVGGVVSTVHVTYTLPRWIDRDAAPAALQSRWDRYLTSLYAHEKGHGAIALEVARMMERELVGLVDPAGCEALHVASGKVVERVMQRGEALQQDYDRATGHGSTQGAQFPF